MNSTIVRTYTGRAGGLSDKDAQITGEFLEQKLGPDEGCSPVQFVELARPARSPIHHLIEWDDSKAAEEHRLWQARHVLGNILVVVSNGSDRKTRAFQNVVVYSEEGAERTYMPSHVVWSSPDLSDQVIEQARRYLKTFGERYREYEQLAGALAHVEKALQEIET